MGMTTVEKILASHSDQKEVKPGDVVMVQVDVSVHFDSMRPDVLRINDPKKVVLLHDHLVPAPTVQAANNAKLLREFVEKFEVPNYFPVGAHGISHVLVGGTQLPRPGNGSFRDALHPLQGQDVVPRRTHYQGRARR
jgi:3-isopropylmalate/(R)-2-methylmalate dehydratase large subunit